jgi:aminoglycoside phosphotransferase (APT) family kinase protein
VTAVPRALRAALERGDFHDMAGLYGEHSVLDLNVPGERARVQGRAGIVARLSELFPGPGRLVEWNPQESEHGVALWLEVALGSGEALRQRQYLHVDGGEITKHWIYSAPPRSTQPAPEQASGGRRAIEHVGPIRSHELVASTGWSGARLERAELEDGRRVYAKRIVPGLDWLGKHSGDRGREALLFRDALHRLPPAVDTAVIDAVEEEDGWWLVMRDVSDELLDLPRPITREEHRLVMRAMNEMWEEFWGEEVPHVMSQANRLMLVSPTIARLERDGTDLLPKQLESAWEAFAEAVPPDVAQAVIASAEDPGPLAEQLARHGTTLIHGDLRDEQLGLPGDRIVLIDWGIAAQAHPVVELGWYLCHCAWRIEATRDELVEDFRRARGDADDADVVALGLLSGLVMYGWIFGIAARIHTDPAERAWAREELDWWVPKARDALERVWSP